MENNGSILTGNRWKSKIERSAKLWILYYRRAPLWLRFSFSSKIEKGNLWEQCTFVVDYFLSFASMLQCRSGKDGILIWIQFDEIEIYTKLFKNKIRWVNLRPLVLAINSKQLKLNVTALTLFTAVRFNVSNIIKLFIIMQIALPSHARMRVGLIFVRARTQWSLSPLIQQTWEAIGFLNKCL